MKTDEYYNRWLATRRALDIPQGWTESVMRRVERYEASRHSAAMCVQAWMAWLGHCLPARAALLLVGSLVCVTRLVVLILAVLG